MSGEYLDTNTIDLFAEAFGLSNTEIRKLFKQGSLSINNEKLLSNRSVGTVGDWKVLGECWIGFILGIGKKQREMFCLQRKTGEVVLFTGNPDQNLIEIKT